jgi:hypothetical protein
MKQKLRKESVLLQGSFKSFGLDIHREETEQDKTQFIRKPRVIVCGSCLSASRFVYLKGSKLFDF